MNIFLETIQREAKFDFSIKNIWISTILLTLIDFSGVTRQEKFALDPYSTIWGPDVDAISGFFTSSFLSMNIKLILILEYLFD